MFKGINTVACLHLEWSNRRVGLAQAPKKAAKVVGIDADAAVEEGQAWRHSGQRARRAAVRVPVAGVAPVLAHLVLGHHLPRQESMISSKHLTLSMQHLVFGSLQQSTRPSMSVLFSACAHDRKLYSSAVPAGWPVARLPSL